MASDFVYDDASQFVDDGSTYDSLPGGSRLSQEADPHAPNPLNAALAQPKRVDYSSLYGTAHRKYKNNAKAWGAHPDGLGSSMTPDEREMFKESFRQFSKGKKYIHQDDMRLYLHHLQEEQADGSFVYMFSENQASRMMPSLEDSPQGLDLTSFLNLMYHVHEETEWSAQKIIHAFSRNDAHYGRHPGGYQEGQGKKGSCIVS